MTMRTIHLHGVLADKFGSPHKFDVSTVRQAASALCQLKGFRCEVQRGSYLITAGEGTKRFDVVTDMLDFCLGDHIRVIHIYPAVEGEKRGGIGKVIVGIALVAVAFLVPPSAPATIGILATEAGVAVGATGFGVTAFTLAGTAVSFGQVALFGASLTLSGVSQLLSPAPRVSGSQSRELADQRPSFLFNGPVNVAAQGHPIPLVYGIMRVGSVVVSAGLEVEQI